MIKKILAVCIISNLILISCEQRKSETHQKMADSTSAIQETTTANTKDSTVVKISKDEMDTFSKSVVGKYIATACDGGRFSIEIKNSGEKMTFDIFDKTKVIKSGTMNVGGKYVGTNNIDVSLGGIGGLVQKDKIVVQNSGNNMNPFENFKKCGDKYLDFTKQ